jgi:hypothetical protein
VILADAPTTWSEDSSLSTLEALLIFAGIPLLVVGVVTLLVMAPSLAKGPRYRPTEDWDAESEWFGGPAEGAAGELPPGASRQLPAGASVQAAAARTSERPATASTPGTVSDAETGGASARW